MSVTAIQGRRKHDLLNTWEGAHVKSLGSVLLLIGLWLGSAFTQAAPITLVGDTINYVYDDTQSALALYGSPTIVGDVVVFLPTEYRAQSLNGEPTDTVVVDFVFSSVYSSTPGGIVSPVQVLESGDYAVGNGGSVGVELGVRIQDNNSPFLTEGSTQFSDSGDTGNSALWELGASFNAGPLTDIEVTLRNVLIASSGDVREFGWVQKKLIFLTAAPDILQLPPGGPGFPVPAPGVLMLMGLGMVALALSRRTKSKQNNV